MRNSLRPVKARRYAVALSLFVLASCKDRAELETASAASPSSTLANGDHDASPPRSEKTSHGVVMVTLENGTGREHPGPRDYVEVKYTGWNRTGEVFEGGGSNAHYLDMAQIIPGLAEALSTMVEGDKRHLSVPADQAYGPRLAFVNAPRDEMTFDVELDRIIRLPPVPTDLASPPAEAKKTPSGLAYELLARGTGTVHPKRSARVEIRYATWTPDGKMIESSYLGPGTIPAQLPRLMKGWSEGLARMVEGDQMRLWIPGKLAHGDSKPDDDAPPFAPPRGPLVIDVELVKILSP